MHNSYNYNFGILVLRLFLGFFMLLHGYAKLNHGTSGIENMLSSQGFPTFFAYGVYVGEIVAPILLIIGLKVRLAACIILFNMLFAIYLVHPSDLISLTKNGGLVLELQYFYIVNSIALIFLGAGKFGFDNN